MFVSVEIRFLGSARRVPRQGPKDKEKKEEQKTKSHGHVLDTELHFEGLQLVPLVGSGHGDQATVATPRG